jgi:cytochrome c
VVEDHARSSITGATSATGRPLDNRPHSAKVRVETGVAAADKAVGEEAGRRLSRQAGRSGGREGMRFGLVVAAAALISTAVAADAQDAAKGEKVFIKCKACHMVGPDAKNRVGPILNGVVGGKFGHIADYKYSKVILERQAAGDTWTDENLTAWLSNPKQFAPGNKMAFAGLKKPEDIADVIAYLKTFP